MGSSSFLDGSLKEFLDAVPARTPAPGGGAVAAVALSLAAGLTAMAARFAADDWERRAEVVGRAEELRARAEPLADADAEAYGAFMAERTEATVDRIVAIPFELAEIAAEVAGLAAAVAAEGNPNVSGDAAAGADLAVAVASIAARLVAINADEGDARVADARRHAAEAGRAAARAAVSDVSQGLSPGRGANSPPNERDPRGGALESAPPRGSDDRDDA